MCRVYQIIVILLYGSYVWAKNSSCTLHQGDRLKAYLLKYCPVTEEEECVDDTLDNLSAIRYRCFNFEASTNNSNMTVHLLHATEMMVLLRLKETEAKRKSSCIISLFYAPECQFSARLAPDFNALPYRFPRLTVVAIDATDFSKFNSRYGITGTPTVILWVNGMAVARMDDRPLNSEGLDGFIKHWTDLEPRALPSEPITSGPLLLEADPSVNFKYVVLSWIILFSAFDKQKGCFLSQATISPFKSKSPAAASLPQSQRTSYAPLKTLPNDAMTNRESTLPYERMADSEEPQPSEEISPAELSHNNWGSNIQIHGAEAPSTTRRNPCGYGGATSSGSQTDEESVDDGNGTTPLLGAGPSSSGDVRVDMPNEDKPASPHDRFPKEKTKTILSCILVVFSGFLNTLTLSFVHELLPDQPPLPDVGFRHTTYYALGLNICEYLMLGSFTSVLVLILFHRHRWIVLRRLAFIGSILYLCRCITMYSTIVPKADPNYYCSPKLGENATFWLISRRAIEVMAGMGLNLFGKHSLCGDYIYSGHTIVLTISALFIGEYTPRRWKIVHLASWLIALAGMILLIISRGHYTIDVILSYFICTRVFWTYHTLAAHPTLKTSSNSHLRKEWWFIFFRYIEGSVVKPIPRRYDIPIPLPRKVAAFLRRRKANVQ